MAGSPLLELCQEVRDIILEYALLDDDERVSNGTSPLDDEQKVHTTIELGDDDDDDGTKTTTSWKFQLSPSFPTPTWLNLMHSNRQLRDETTDFLARKQHMSGGGPMTAKATLHLRHPICTPVWTSLPAPPRQTQRLELLVKVDSLYAAAMQPPSSALWDAVGLFLRRCLDRGPRLRRHAALREPWRLETVRVTFALPREGMECVYGNPWMQLQNLYLGVKGTVKASRWSHPGVGKLEMRREGRTWERVLSGEEASQSQPEDGRRVIHEIVASG